MMKLTEENFTEIDPNGPLPASKLEAPMGLASVRHPDRVKQEGKNNTFTSLLKLALATMF